MYQRAMTVSPAGGSGVAESAGAQDDVNELRGHLSEDELKANDSDHDGTLTKDEYLAIVEQRFKAADANHDGKLKIDEFTSVAGGSLVKLITYQVGGIALPPKRN